MKELKDFLTWMVENKYYHEIDSETINVLVDEFCQTKLIPWEEAVKTKYLDTELDPNNILVAFYPQEEWNEYRNSKLKFIGYDYDSVLAPYECMLKTENGEVIEVPVILTDRSKNYDKK